MEEDLSGRERDILWRASTTIQERCVKISAYLVKSVTQEKFLTDHWSKKISGKESAFYGLTGKVIFDS